MKGYIAKSKTLANCGARKFMSIKQREIAYKL